MDDKYIGLVKKFYDEKGIEQIAIVEAVHMIHFAEWLEQYAAQPLRAVDAPKPCDNFRKARDGKCFNCGCEQSAHH